MFRLCLARNIILCGVLGFVYCKLCRTFKKRSYSRIWFGFQTDIKGKPGFVLRFPRLTQSSLDGFTIVTARFCIMIRSVFIVMLSLLIAGTARAEEDKVLELHLVLAFDVSASVNDAEFALQRDGTAEAFRSFKVHAAIEAAPGGVAVSVVQWSSIAQQALGLDWAHLKTREDIDRFADHVEAMPRRLPGGGTMIHAGLRFAGDMFETAPGVARRRVIDLSGNGRTDDEPALLEMRDRLNRQGIVINALAVEEDHRDLTRYFNRLVIGGAGAFVETADDFPVFTKAMERKLYREISGPSYAGLGP